MKKDIFDLLKSDGLPDATHEGALPILSLWQATTYYLMFFTLSPDQIASHFDDDERCYLCLGDDCPACKAGVKATAHVYLPVWDAQNRRIAVLKFDTRLDGPSAKILPFLRCHRERLADVVAVVQCRGGGEFTITPHNQLPETDRGALECQAFCDALESGAIDLHDCVKTLKRETIVALRSVKKLATPVVGGAFSASSVQLNNGERIAPEKSEA